MKQHIKNEEGSNVLTIQPEFKFQPIFNFFQGTHLIYKGKVKKLSLTRFSFILENVEGHPIANINQVPVHKKKSIFKEYHIYIDDVVFKVSFKLADSSFSISDGEGNLAVQADRVSSFMKRVVEYKKYRFKVNENRFPLELWMANGAGVVLLD